MNEETTVAAPTFGFEADELELTILMPCLDERETVATCIRKARSFLTASRIKGEVLIADNGSVDGSQQIAVVEGARVVQVPARGYGAALLRGIAAARGRFIIMGDADDSYDFSSLQPFVDKLREGFDLVMGNRFRGGIAEGAMPMLHKYLGNPVLSFLGRLFFSIDINDFHCGLRGFNTSRIRALQLRTTGMEFASEMVVRAALSRYRITEVPTTLAKDGRSRPPHLRTWEDGWRHLRFLLMYSPRWLFLYPGIGLFGLGLAGVGLLLLGPVNIGDVSIDVHTFLVACVCILLGLQSITFAAISRRYATSHGLIPPSPRYASILEALTLERLLIAALVVGVLGLIGVGWCLSVWASGGFGPIRGVFLLRVLMVSLTAVAAAVQLVFSAFLASIVAIPLQK
jgi:glycosyltransferase involved in cell wall biosynthesis